MSTERELADAILRDSLLLQRVAAGDQAEADRILNRLAGELRELLLLSDVGANERRKLDAMLRNAEEIIARGYGDLSKVVDTQQLAEIIAGHTNDALASILQVPARTVTLERLASLTADVMIEGAPLSDWWARQEDDTKFKFAAQVRQGVINGETQARIVQRVVGRAGEPGILDVTRRNARTLVHSAVMSAANQARLETFRKNSRFVGGVTWLATLDSRTCLVCGALDGQRWDLDGKPLKGTKQAFEAPPKHVSCRCTLSPIPKAFVNREPTNPGQRASSQGPVAGDMTFEAFLQRQSSDFLERALGKGKAELFLAGKVTLRDLLSQTGRPLTLAELRAR